jgi:hypothetical protein
MTANAEVHAMKRICWPLIGLGALSAAIIASDLLMGGVARAQAPAVTTNGSQAIATGNTYQLLLAAGTRRGLTIENNNTGSDDCWIEVSGLVAVGATTATSVTPPGLSAITAVKASIRLSPGGQWSRYFPYIPSGAIVGTCTITGDSIYVDTQ